MTLAASVYATLRARFQDRMFSAPRGRAFVLRQLGAAEDTDEGRIFTELERRVDDPELAKLIRIHREDETRHARLYFEAADRLGVPAEPVPERLQLLPRLDRALGGFFERIGNDGSSVMEAYLLLQVIEERAASQFAELEVTARRHDAALADTIAGIARDEQRHLKYCRAIAKRYAPDQAAIDRTLAHMREVEARVFVEHSRDVLDFVLDHGLLDVSDLELAAWRGLRTLNRRTPVRPQPTPFATAAAAA
jgi:hypothetical protein